MPRQIRSGQAQSQIMRLVLKIASNSLVRIALLYNYASLQSLSAWLGLAGPAWCVVSFLSLSDSSHYGA